MSRPEDRVMQAIAVAHRQNRKEGNVFKLAKLLVMKAYVAAKTKGHAILRRTSSKPVTEASMIGRLFDTSFYLFLFFTTSIQTRFTILLTEGSNPCRITFKVGHGHCIMLPYRKTHFERTDIGSSNSSAGHDSRNPVRSRLFVFCHDP